MHPLQASKWERAFSAPRPDLGQLLLQRLENSSYEWQLLLLSSTGNVQCSMLSCPPHLSVFGIVYFLGPILSYPCMLGSTYPHAWGNW